MLDSREHGAAVFWMLILMGAGAFAPCVVLPEWRAYQAAHIAQQREQHRVDQLRSAVQRHRRQLDAIQNDPTVVARLAQRDLGFHRPGETVVAVPVADGDGLAPELDQGLFVPEAVPPPVLFSRATWWLPDFDYDAIFCDPSTRPIIMVMSLSLIVLAVVLFRNPRAAQYQTDHE